VRRIEEVYDQAHTWRSAARYRGQTPLPARRVSEK
jgi:hypothetical protein